MKQKLSALFLSLVLLISLALTVYAETADLVVDQIDLLTDQEEQALTNKASTLGQKYGMDVVIVTNQSLGGKTPEQYADDYYDYNGYGPDGVLFLLSMEDRDWYISTAGACIYALTDYGIQQLGETALPYLGSGNYYRAFDAYLDALDPYFARFTQGDPIDGQADQSGNFYAGTQETVVHYNSRSTLAFGSRFLRSLPSSVVLGLIIAFIVLMVQRSTMKAKRTRTAAAIYMVDNSYRMGHRSDTFLYTNTTKTRIQENSSSGGSHSSSGGGSSTHHSSSGSSHGGGGGKF